MTTPRHGRKRTSSPPAHEKEAAKRPVVGARQTQRQSASAGLSFEAERKQQSRRRRGAEAQDAAVAPVGLQGSRHRAPQRRPDPVPAAGDGPSGDASSAARESDLLAQSLAASLAGLAVTVPPDGDFSQVVEALCDGIRRLSVSKETAESQLSGVAADRAALKALVATQREELQGLRRQVEGLSEALRQQRLVDGRQLGELSQRYGELLATYREFRVQADTIYAAFEHLRSTGLTGLWRVFGPTIRDQELYDAVVLILTSGLFDEAYFCRQCGAGEIPVSLNPIIYYLKRGDGLGRDPHPLFSVRHYRTQLPAARRGGNSLLDYLQFGHDLAPHPLFMPSYYVEQLPGLANITGIAPLMHYCIAGTVLGASPHPLFDNAYYSKQLEAEASQPPANLLSFYLSRQSDASPHPLFDAEFYRSRYLEGQTDSDPLLHYLTVGDSKGHNPHAYFHTRFYRRANPDAGQDGTAALVHFILKGADDNRAPHPMFDMAYYKRANPEITEAGHRLLVHFAAGGGSERGQSASVDRSCLCQAPGSRSASSMTADRFARCSIRRMSSGCRRIRCSMSSFTGACHRGPLPTRGARSCTICWPATSST